MKKTKIGLEKRTFLLFFVITLLVIFILIFFAAQLAKYGIKINENSRISDIISEVKLAHNNLETKSKIHLGKIALNSQVLKAIEQKESLNFISDLDAVISDSKTRHISIYDKQQNLIFGESWEMIERYIPNIFEEIKKNVPRNFMANFGKKIYQITYSSLYSDSSKDDFLGIILSVELIEITRLNLKNSNNVFLFPYPFDLSSFKYREPLSNFYSSLDNKIQQMISENKTESIYRLNMEWAFSVNIYYDITLKPSAICVTSYYRNINQFVQKSLLFFTLIIIAISLVITSLLGTWFSKTILAPVKSISDSMKQITKNPSIIEPMEKKYSGVLNDLVKTFNSMNKSLTEYSRYLSEYKIITDNLNTGIFWLDSEFQIIVCNPSLVRIFEQDNEKQIIGKNINDFLKLNENQIQKAKSFQITLPSFQVNLAGKNKFVMLDIKSVKERTSQRFVGLLADITDEVKARMAQESLELELIKVNKLAEIGKRVEGVVHNINSPLNSILGFAQLLKKNLPENDDLQKIIHAGRNISLQVKSLLRKVREDNIAMLRPIDINELIKQELNLCQHNLYFKHYVSLKTNLSKTLPKIKAAYGDISQVAANLLNNAIESLKESSVKNISVRTYETDEFIAIEIKDTGCGIERKNINKIFEPYFTTKTQTDKIGFGLGLAICKYIYEKYNGRITVETEIGEGSCFTLFLPISDKLENEPANYEDNHEKRIR